jgi:hypothetical protein
MQKRYKTIYDIDFFANCLWTQPYELKSTNTIPTYKEYQKVKLTASLPLRRGGSAALPKLDDK